ncbi:MAG: hypothetical protein M3O94_04040 [Actinomycetota bacterium]|nr:hypothetical protein [Actinomycetota bacterium]
MPGTTIARAESVRGEVTLRRRETDGALELLVNGVFVMDTAESTTETALADLALGRLTTTHEPGARDRSPVKVLIGGLGLGFTLRRLAGNTLVDEIIVVEIEGALIDWHRSGLVPATTEIIRDPRLRLVEGDVREVVATIPDGTLDALILDVDNGPGFLVYDDNAAVYQSAFLATCHAALRDGGALVVWSADEAPCVDVALRRTFGAVDHLATEVPFGTRREHYHTYVGVKGRAEDPPCQAR